MECRPTHMLLLVFWCSTYVLATGAELRMENSMPELQLLYDDKSAQVDK